MEEGLKRMVGAEGKGGVEEEWGDVKVEGGGRGGREWDEEEDWEDVEGEIG